ncbi:hypothetical protein DLJ53_01260 [Acuticoccus sediminis]|uniref:Serine aminopeptidase S33 domain-containing protein n=1 Tax=Acuticoccus sediminis TaxID=2184697 RepID=A0A8B2NV15_9HYPH|nr:alpha/beta fold hydrolase [Acuticoccus sediminis]RAI03183.1 hypothetical protein DLJ53_01260 [Acuticoccus sediminis]
MTVAPHLHAERPAEVVPLDGSAGPMWVHVYRPSETHVGCAVIAHGRNGAAGAPHMTPMIGAALKRGFTVVAPDLCCSAHNASAGDAGDFTMAAHHADLCRVVDFVAAEEPGEPGQARVLVGHSMGAYAAVRIAAEGHRWEPTGVVAVSPVISGAALIAARKAQGGDALAALSRELPGALDEWRTHDVIPGAGNVRIPAAVVVGADDTVTPPADAAKLANALPRCVWRDVLPGEHHCPVGPDYMRSMGTAFDRLLAAA